MPAPTLFFYGTLQDADILAAVLGRELPDTALQMAEAPCHCAVYYPGAVYPALVEARGQTAMGLVFTEATDVDLAALDAFEGEGYERMAITVQTRAGIENAHYYRATIEIPANAAPWTLADWQARHKPLVLASETEAAHRARADLG